MARGSERKLSPQPSASGEPTSTEAPSPTRSDRSDGSEGRPVREKLRKTRIGAPGSDQPMQDAANGADDSKLGSRSSSGSEQRGRLSRKRSHEEVDEGTPTKKQEGHARKKSRDVTSPAPSDAKLKTSVSRIAEQDGDAAMGNASVSGEKANTRSNGRNTPAHQDDDAESTNPKNKRTHDQLSSGEAADAGSAEAATPESDKKKADEPITKRPREKSEVESATIPAEGATKIPPGSGFANVSAASPFASLSPKKQAPPPAKPAQDLPQTSDEKFKASGFGSFASSTVSPFGAVGSKSPSPFAAASTGAKTSGLPSAAAPAASSGFGALGSSGKSVFGGTLGGGGFGSIGGNKLSSFAKPGTTTISGLSSKPARPFGASTADNEEDEEDDSGDDKSDAGGDNDDAEKSTQPQEKEKKSVFVPQDVETGEENETTIYTARGKLYHFSEGWKERGAGVFKLNQSNESPKRSRFILRADGTHRLLLNCPVGKGLIFGGNAQGEEPRDGKILFNAPTSEGKLEVVLLKMKGANAIELWKKVKDVKEKMEK
ncbi:hypothetical protein M011DRAFT_466453 [Sporormia fimetaria CBS 119925]|uniref:RanBD1 domain-containing protein n=1 Tax=Sporormia fimetaria CBS 119925 TaxID=1340428 RepID=A0A6A6VHU7_9PLEO|nr:hypothetical protein M011DRAFT_466453 [Sporormia fimetaria CBS 119925]